MNNPPRDDQTQYRTGADSQYQSMPGQGPYPQQPYPGYPPPGYPPSGYQQGYPPPGYWQPGPYQQAPPATRWNGLAIASMILGIVWVYSIGSILAVIFGHIALRQTRRDGTRGRGMAIAGLVLGYIGVGIIALLLIHALINTSG